MLECGPWTGILKLNVNTEVQEAFPAATVGPIATHKGQVEGFARCREAGRRGHAACDRRKYEAFRLKEVKGVAGEQEGGLRVQPE
jgi:fructose/tagatose bisphosphate aldolase